VPWFNALGVHYTLTILACISALMTPVPFGKEEMMHEPWIKES